MVAHGMLCIIKYSILYSAKARPGIGPTFADAPARGLAGSRPLRPVSPLRGCFDASRTQGLRPGLIYVTATRLGLMPFWIFTSTLGQEEPPRGE